VKLFGIIQNFITHVFCCKRYCIFYSSEKKVKHIFCTGILSATIFFRNFLDNFYWGIKDKIIYVQFSFYIKPISIFFLISLIAFKNERKQIIFREQYGVQLECWKIFFVILMYLIYIAQSSYIALSIFD
jgi:hypothetical protein